MSDKVLVTVSGPVGIGKSAVYFEIAIALKAIGLTITHEDQAEWNMEGGLRAYIGPPDTDIAVHMQEVVSATPHQEEQER